jgi:hypothetical protein
MGLLAKRKAAFKSNAGKIVLPARLSKLIFQQEYPASFLATSDELAAFRGQNIGKQLSERHECKAKPGNTQPVVRLGKGRSVAKLGTGCEERDPH